MTRPLCFPYFAALVPCLGTGILLHAGQAKYLGWLFRNPLSVGIGLVSYSLYLIHWPIYVFYKYYSFEELSLLEKWGICGVSILAAFLMYRFIEQPFRRSGKLRFPASNGVYVKCCIFAAILASVPAFPYLSQWRLGLAAFARTIKIVRIGKKAPRRAFRAMPLPQRFRRAR